MSGETKGIQTRQLLSQYDPEPFEIINASSDHPLLIVCEHAGQKIPSSLGNLGISQTELNSHIGWDIGAKNVTLQMAQLLGAPAILQRYSRLVIDCNRPYDAPDAMPEISDGIKIPGNYDLDATERIARKNEIFDPYQNAIETSLSNHQRRIALSIHSFSPSMNGKTRPWEIGFLFRKDTETSQYLKTFVQDLNPELTIGMNEPYQVDDRSDWFIPRHGEMRDIPHSLIELRNDQIDTPKGQIFWAETLVNAIQCYLKEI